MYYNVHLVWPDMYQEKICVEANDKEAALTLAHIQHAISGGAFAHKVIGPIGQAQSPKQKLAQKYGFIIGGIKGAKQQLVPVKRDMLANPNLDLNKVERVHSLVDMQFSKLLRDISDLFKLAGLKVK